MRVRAKVDAGTYSTSTSYWRTVEETLGRTDRSSWRGVHGGSPLVHRPKLGVWLSITKSEPHHQPSPSLTSTRLSNCGFMNESFHVMGMMDRILWDWMTRAIIDGVSAARQQGIEMWMNVRHREWSTVAPQREPYQPDSGVTTNIQLKISRLCW